MADIQAFNGLRYDLGHVGSLSDVVAPPYDVIGPQLRALALRHPCVGEVRGLGVFWALELVRDRETREPLVAFNAHGAQAKPMAEFAARCKDQGLWPFVHFNRTHIVPPCTTSADDVSEGIAILDDALKVADMYYTGR